MTAVPLILLLLGVIAAPATAEVPGRQPSVTESRVNYPPRYFAEAVPVTALDMVRRLPGFVIDTGQVARGLAGTSANVLIDGRQPVTRAETISDLLRRIPASEVERIELIRGGAPGLEVQGNQIVANVIRLRGNKGWGALTVAGTYQDGKLHPQLNLDAGYGGPEFSVDGSASGNRSTGFTDDGRFFIFDPSGRTVRDDILAIRYRSDGVSFSIRSEQETKGGARIAAHATSSRNRNFSDLNAFARSVTLPSTAYSYISEGQDRYNEVGAEFETLVGAGTSLRFNAVATFGRNISDEDYEDDFYNARSTSRSNYDEQIFRAILTRTLNDAFTVEVGAEGALNKVSQAFRLGIDGTEVDIPAKAIRIGEQRAEVHSELRWRLSSNLTTYGDLRWETSRLHVQDEGQAEESRSFSFFKPRIGLVYRADPDMTLRFRAEREVSQLVFSDFVASAAIDSVIIDAGNKRLAPEQSWTFELAADRRFSKNGAVELSLLHSRISDVIDYLVLPGGFDAIGNIGKGHRWVVRAKSSLPLDALGLTGGLIRIDLSWRGSSVTDAITGKKRRLSREKPIDGVIRFSHDIPRFRSSWGVDYHLETRSRRFRIATETLDVIAPRLTFYAEHKPSPAWVFRTELNVGGADSRVRRTFYLGSRANSDVRLVEERLRNSSTSAFLSIRRSF